MCLEYTCLTFFFFGQSKLPLNQNKPETRSIQRPTAKKHQNSISTNQNQKPTPKNKKLQSTNTICTTKISSNQIHKGGWRSIDPSSATQSLRRSLSKPIGRLIRRSRNPSYLKRYKPRTNRLNIIQQITTTPIRNTTSLIEPIHLRFTIKLNTKSRPIWTRFFKASNSNMSNLFLYEKKRVFIIIRILGMTMGMVSKYFIIICICISSSYFYLLIVLYL